jgi:hypothetical protein
MDETPKEPTEKPESKKMAWFNPIVRRIRPTVWLGIVALIYLANQNPTGSPEIVEETIKAITYIVTFLVGQESSKR